MPQSEITEVIPVCNRVNKIFPPPPQKREKNRFIPQKLFGQLLKISPTNVIFLKTFNSDFSCIEFLVYRLE